MDRKIIYTPKEGVENGAQRMTSKNSIKLLNSNTEGLKTMKQCLKKLQGYFHLYECTQSVNFNMRADQQRRSQKLSPINL